MLNWNAGTCCDKGEAAGVDDVGFMKAVLEDIAKKMPIDKNRIFAAGLSSGGMLAYRLANELSEEIAAVAIVGGSDCNQKVNPTLPVSILHFHGTDDTFVPYGGGKAERDFHNVNHLAVEKGLSRWVEALGCPPGPLTTTLPDTAMDGTRAIITRWKPGRVDSEVVLVKIEGAGHAWPGRSMPVLRDLLGRPTRQVDATEMMWEFFAKHSRSR